MTTLTYEAALAQIKQQVPDMNYVVLNFGYDARFVFPFEAGCAVLAAFTHAEQTGNHYGNPETLIPLKSDAVRMTLMSAMEYRHIKTCQLLGVTPEEYKKAQEQNGQ